MPVWIKNQLGLSWSPAQRGLYQRGRNRRLAKHHMLAATGLTLLGIAWAFMHAMQDLPPSMTTRGRQVVPWALFATAMVPVVWFGIQIGAALLLAALAHRRLRDEDAAYVLYHQTRWATLATSIWWIFQVASMLERDRSSQMEIRMGFAGLAWLACTAVQSCIAIAAYRNVYRRSQRPE